MKKLKLNKDCIGEIEFAMQSASYEVDWYLDTKTSEVLMFGIDIPSIEEPLDEDAAN